MRDASPFLKLFCPGIYKKISCIFIISRNSDATIGKEILFIRTVMQAF
jgi:hypothetical protein